MFLGFDDGKVVSFRPGRNQVTLVAKGPGLVSALAVDPDGQAVVALRQTEHASILSCSLRRPDGTFRTGTDGHFPSILASWLTPILPWGTDWLVGLGHGRDLLIVNAASWMSRSGLTIAPPEAEPPTTALLIPAGPLSDPADDRLNVLTHDGPCWVLFDSGGRELDRTESEEWCPANPTPRPLRCVPVTWIPGSPFVELIGLDKDGAVYVSEFRVEGRRLDVFSRAVQDGADVPGGHPVRVRFQHGRRRVSNADRLAQLETERFQPARSLPSPSLSTAVACYYSNSPEEILVVFADGTVAHRLTPAAETDRGRPMRPRSVQGNMSATAMRPTSRPAGDPSNEVSSRYVTTAAPVLPARAGAVARTSDR